jgi:hypothetical protein
MGKPGINRVYIYIPADPNILEYGLLGLRGALERSVSGFRRDTGSGTRVMLEMGWIACL